MCASGLVCDLLTKWCFMTFDFLSQMETRVKMEEQSPITSAECSPPDASVRGKC